MKKKELGTQPSVNCVNQPKREQHVETMEVQIEIPVFCILKFGMTFSVQKCLL